MILADNAAVASRRTGVPDQAFCPECGQPLTLAGSVRIFAGGLTMGAAALGAGFGIGTSGSALAAATAEKPDIFSRAVITLILAEALAIYALVTALLLVLQAK